MVDPKLVSLRDSGLGFFGAIGASLSHDMNNVLATINELGGLLEELVDASERGKALDPARLKKTLGRIPAQIKRGQTYIKQLNRLSHSVDQDRARLDLNEMLGEVIALCQRFARLREVRLEGSFADVSPVMEGRAFDLLHVIYRSVEIPLAVCSRGSALHITSEALAKGARIVVTGEGESKEDADLQSKKQCLEDLVEAIGGTLELTSEPDGGTRVAIDLPQVLGTQTQGAGDPTA